MRVRRKHSNITVIRALHRPMLHGHIKQAWLNVGERALSLSLSVSLSLASRSSSPQRKERVGEGNLWYSEEKREEKIMAILVLTEGILTGLSAQGESRRTARNKGNHSFRNPLMINDCLRCPEALSFCPTLFHEASSIILKEFKPNPFFVI